MTIGWQDDDPCEYQYQDDHVKAESAGDLKNYMVLEFVVARGFNHANGKQRFLRHHLRFSVGTVLSYMSNQKSLRISVSGFT